MGDTLSKAFFYLFVMGVLLILVGFYVGSSQLLRDIFSGTNMLDLSATGRDQSGNFAAYPVVH